MCCSYYSCQIVFMFVQQASGKHTLWTKLALLCSCAVCCHGYLGPPLPDSKVFVDPLVPDDLLFIAANKFPLLAGGGANAVFDGRGCIDGVESAGGGSLLSRMIAFNRQVVFGVYCCCCCSFVPSSASILFL